MVRPLLAAGLVAVLTACVAAGPAGAPPRAQPAPVSSAAAATPAASVAAAPASSAPAAEPPRSPFLRDITGISVGHGHVCALTRPGALACWGDNAAGQLGVGQDGLSAGRALSRPHLVGGLPPVASVAAGAFHTCAIDLRGRVFCWGAAGGDLKRTAGGVAGSVEQSGKALGKPVEMPLGEGKASLVVLSSKGHEACAVFADEVRCWNTFRAIDPEGRLAPGFAAQTTRIAGVEALAMGHGKVCAVARGDLWCWHPGSPPTAARWSPGDPIAPVKLSIGEMYACVASASGEARCWWSLIGDFWKKPPNRAVRWPGKPATRAIAVGDSPVCTADAAGQVDCFLSEEGGLTDDAVAGSWAIKGIGPHPIAGVDQAVDLGLGLGLNAFGYGFGCALRAAPDTRGAQVFCWGDNESGQLGNGSTAATTAAVPVLGL